MYVQVTAKLDIKNTKKQPLSAKVA